MAWGNEQWAGSAAYNTYIEWRVAQQGEDAAYVQHKFSIFVKTGNYSGTVINRSWGGQVRLYGNGWYGDSGWIDDGWIRYGQSVYRECSAWYTGYSGRFYKSTCGSSYGPSAPTWQPQMVTNQKATRNSQTQATVTWSNQKTTARPYAGIYVDRKVDSADWALLKDVGGNDTSYVDATTRPNHTYQYRVLPHNAAGNAANHAYTNTIANPPTVPSAPTNAKSERKSDSQNVITWDNNPGEETPYASVIIERQTNGGAWAQLSSLGSTVASYTDNTTSADSYYAYRVKASNASGDSAYATTGTTYNTPAAPGTPYVVRTGDTSVSATMSNVSKTTTALEVQRSTDGKTWSTISTISGARVTAFTDTPGGGTFYYRARNTRGSLVSAWSGTSSAVVTICAPAAPTLLSPLNGSVQLSTAQVIQLRWMHNPIDGSSQTAAQVRWSTDGTTWKTMDVTTAQRLNVDNSFAVNSTVSWQVRTKGVHADYGPWSGTATFKVCRPPQLSVDSPGDTVSNLPIKVSVSYDDVSGSLADLVLQVVTEVGSVLFEADMGTSTTYTIQKSQWVPDDGATYYLSLSARSTSTLQQGLSSAFTVKFEPPKAAFLNVEADIERGYAELRCTVDQTDDGQDVESMSVWRLTESGEKLLGGDVSDGQSIEDRYAPLNTEYSYKVVTFAASGASRSTLHRGSIKTPYCFLYYGADGIARGQYDPTESRSIKRASRTLVRYAGRTYPVAYDAGGLDDERKVSVHVMGDIAEERSFERLMEHGRCVFKGIEGDVFWAVADLDLDPTLTLPGHHADVSLDLTRVDGEAL
jgi:hypothetical protein